MCTQGDRYLIVSTISVVQLQMTTLYESLLKGPEMIMTLTSDHDYPKILKDMMKHIHLEGCSLQRIPLHAKGSGTLVCGGTPPPYERILPKDDGQYFFISCVPQATFFDAVREAAMEAMR